jgi:hypothetical protein
MLLHGHAEKFREGWFKIRKLQGIWPIIFIRGPKYFKNFEYLIYFTVTLEERLLLSAFSKDTSC